MNTVSEIQTQGALIPDQAQRVGNDPIFALHGEALARAAGGEDILDATIGVLVEDDLSLSVLPTVFETLAGVAPEQAAAYAPIAGAPGFLGAVVQDLYGGGAMAEQSVATSTPGGTGAIYQAVGNFLEPGQKLFTTSYRWGPYDIIAGNTGRGVETFPMYNAAGGFDLASFERGLAKLMDEQGRALVILNTPCHNPTGYSLDDEEWAGVASIVGELAARGPMAVLIDLAYARFAPREIDWVRHAESILERATVLVAWSASKSYAQYGARVGALVASHRDPDQRQRIKNALGYSCRGTWSNCNHLGQLAVTKLLSDPELARCADLERARLGGLLNERVERFNGLAREQGLAYPRYEGGFFVAVFTPDALATAARMRELGVYVVPLAGAVRVALCATPVAAVPRLVNALADGLRAAGG